MALGYKSQAPRDQMRGNTEPRVYTPPLRPVWPRSPETEKNTLGFNVIDFAEDILKIVLYPWQAWLLAHALEVHPNGAFRYRTVVILVARQNGKSVLGQVLALWVLYVLQLRLIIGTAQDLATAEDLWKDVVEIAEGNPDLAPLIKNVNRASGKKSLELVSGAEYKIKAPTRKSARGLSADLLLIDELREHTEWAAWGAITKTMMARPRAQAWGLSNAGDAQSVVLMYLRKKAHARLGDPDGTLEEELGAAPEPPDGEVDDTSLGLFEWSAAPGRDTKDRAGWKEANPGLGYGSLTEASLAAAEATDPEPIFRTECLCQWEEGSLQGPFPDSAWTKCADLTGEIAEDSDLSYAVDVSFGRGTAWVAVAGNQVGGRPQVEIIAGRPGGGWLDWVPEYFERIASEDNPIRVVVPSRGMNPASVLVEPLRRVEGVTVVEWGGPDMSQACGLFYDRVVSVLESPQPFPPLAHRGQEALNIAALTAQSRPSGDGWYWDRRNSPQDAAPLVAATGALWDLLRLREDPPAPSIYENGPLALI